MHRLLALLALPPFLTLTGHGALDMRPKPLPYPDLSAESRYALPVQILTDRGVLHGYPDGTVRVDGKLNRAEFLKIVLLSAGLPLLQRSSSCFPDVPPDTWFAGTVCTAKARGVVSGYPDGSFQPAREVNLAEALKILVGVFGHATTPREEDQWFFPYFRTTRGIGIAIDPKLSADASITRGTMAELAAQFLAESLGELRDYHDSLLERMTTKMEDGVPPEPPSEEPTTAVFPEQPATSNDQSFDPSTGLGAGETPPPLPPHFFDLAMSRLVYVNAESPPIAGVTLFSENEPVYLQEVEVELKNVTNSVNYLNVYLGSGELLGRAVRKRKPNLDDVFYRLDIAPDATPLIPQAQSTRIVVTARLKDADQGFQAGEFFEVQNMKLAVIGGWTNRNQSKGSPELEHPRHQVTLALLDDISNAGPDEGILAAGTDRTIGSFLFATQLTDKRAKVAVEHLTFTLSKTSDVAVSNLILGADGTLPRHPCTVSGDLVQCLAIPSELGSLDQRRIISLHGDVSITPLAPAPRLSISLSDPGSPQHTGAVRWTDGTYHYTWVEEEEPVATGTTWK